MGSGSRPDKSAGIITDLRVEVKPFGNPDGGSRHYLHRPWSLILMRRWVVIEIEEEEDDDDEVDDD